MDSHFYVRETEKGLELTFRTGNNRQLLKWMPFSDMDALRAFVKMLKRKADRKHFIVFPWRGNFYFALMDKFKLLRCCSHPYSKKQKAEQGLTAFVRDMANAKIKVLTDF